MATEVYPSPAGKSGKSRVKPYRVAGVLLAVIGVLLLVDALLLTAVLTYGKTSSSAHRNSVFSVAAITVSGDTHEQDAAILAAAGIQKGDSLFSVNKGKIASTLRSAFPYMESVSVVSRSLNRFEIIVKEAPVMGAVYCNGTWMQVGFDGRGLETMPIISERPQRYLYIKGLKPAAKLAGQKVMDDRSLSVVKEIRAALEKYQITGVGIIDISDYTDVKLDWKNQITMELGNTSNLTYEIAVISSSLPKVLDTHGETASGVLDLSLYAESGVSSPYAVFTPVSLSAETSGSGNGGNQPASATTATTAAKTTKTTAKPAGSATKTTAKVTTKTTTKTTTKAPVTTAKPTSGSSSSGSSATSGGSSTGSSAGSSGGASDTSGSSGSTTG